MIVDSMYDKIVDIKLSLSFLGAQNQSPSGLSNIKSNRYGLITEITAASSNMHT